jgi:RNA polymerase sigma factor for flagellar operon FliA
MHSPTTTAARTSTAPAIDEHEAVTANRSVVRRLALTLLRRTGPAVELDDLIAAGLLGVVRAARSYDPTLGVPFELYVVRHARWSMLTELRQSHPLRRSVSDRRRQLLRAEERLTHRLHHPPTRADLAQELDAAESTVARWQAEIAAAERHPSFAGLAGRRAVTATTGFGHRTRPDGSSGGGGAAGDGDLEPPDREPLPEDVVVDLELLATLHQAIDELPARLAHVVRATYFEGRLLADVAVELGVTESRVSQLRTDAVKALRLRLHDAETGPVRP